MTSVIKVSTSKPPALRPSKESSLDLAQMMTT
jgi:hypothetical protein